MSKSWFAWWLQQLESGTHFLNDAFQSGKQQEEKTLIVTAGERKYNICHFLAKHPGGSNVLRQFSGRDVKKQMRSKPHEHSSMAYSLLDEYKVEESSPVQAILDDDLIKKEELESKVDWNRGMVFQVGSLGPDYEVWLEFPVDRPLRLFDTPLLERLTRTQWFVVPLVWCPVILFKLLFAARCLGRTLGVWALPGFVLGLLMWSLLEYLVHRFLFHMSISKNNPYLITLHFLLHGLHHKVPFDPDRLVFPPLGTFLLSLPLCFCLWTLFPMGIALLLLAGGFAGYVCYDLCHYYLHHGDPQPNSFFHQLKRYHAQHHFLHHTQGFGITSKLWDTYFGTEIVMK